MKMSKFTRWLIATLLVSVLAFPTVSSAAEQKLLTDVCTFKVPTHDLAASTDSEDNRVTITYTCTAGILSIDVNSKSDDASVVRAVDGIGIINVYGVGAGSTDVVVTVKGYEPARINFNVTSESGGSNSGSETPEEVEDPAIKQINDYVDQLQKLAPFETKAVSTSNKYLYVTAKNRKEAYLAYANTVVPNYTKFLAGLKAIKTPNKELARINNIYIKGASLQMEGLNIKKKALYSTKLDSKLLKQSNEKLVAGTKLINQFSKEFKAYSDKF